MMVIMLYGRVGDESRSSSQTQANHQTKVMYPPKATMTPLKGSSMINGNNKQSNSVWRRKRSRDKEEGTHAPPSAASNRHYLHVYRFRGGGARAGEGRGWSCDHELGEAEATAGNVAHPLQPRV